MYDYCQLFALGRSIRTQHWPLGLFYVMNDKLYVHIRYHHYMTDATESLFTKATYYKRREGLGSPQWHFTTCIPQCFSQKYFLKKKIYF